MNRISKIVWISEYSLEAEVTITDGEYEISCFSQPCNITLNQNIVNPIYCFNSRNIVKSLQNEYRVEKLSEPFAYRVAGQLIDKNANIVKIGGILVQLEDGSLPGDIVENDYICFCCERLDIY